MSPTLRGALLAALLFGAVAGARAEDPPAEPPPAEPTEPTPEPEAEAAPLDAQIKQAIEKGVAFLRTQQLPTGSWGDLNSKAPTYSGGGNPHQHPLGATAMAIYAMLKCDVPVTDPAIVKGLAWLKKAGVKENSSAYELSATLLAVTATADPFKKTKDAAAAGAKVRLAPEFKPFAAALQKALMDRRHPRGWRYSKLAAGNPGGTEDVSSTMFAMLALTAADRCGVPLDPNVVVGVASYVLTLQEKEGPEVPRAVRARRPAAAKPDKDKGRYAGPGSSDVKDHARGFHYSIDPSTKEDDQVVTGARTACGIGVLTLARYFLSNAKMDPAKATVPAKTLDRGIYDGLAWLAQNFSASSNPGAPGGRMINYLYSTERAMDLVGADRLGEHTWYVEMVQALLPLQEERGSWDTKDVQVGERGPVVDTAYALLFLRRAAQGGVPMPIVTGGDDDGPVDNRDR